MKSGFRADLLKGIDAFRSFFGHDPVGYRAPLGKITRNQMEILNSEGFVFDSSVFPSYRPGVYNNMRKPVTPYHPIVGSEFTEYPVAVSSPFRIPVAQSYLKLFGYPYRNYLQRVSLPKPMIFVSHLHDFFPTDAHQYRGSLMSKIHKRNIDKSPEILEEFAAGMVDKGWEFTKMSYCK